MSICKCECCEKVINLDCVVVDKKGDEVVVKE